MVSDMSAVKNLVDVIGTNMSDNNAEFRTTKSNILIVFSNKSTIDIFSSDTRHGKRANLFIADDRIDKEVLRSVFIPYETRFACSAPLCQALMDDVQSQSIEPVSRSEKYQRTVL